MRALHAAAQKLVERARGGGGGPAFIECLTYRFHGHNTILEAPLRANQETFGYLVTEVSEQELAFLGPARSMGVVTGDDEKDTVAYRTMLGIMVNEHWSFRLEW